MRGYTRCFHCGGKPKAYREEDKWFLDHDCKFQSGRVYLAGDTLGEVMTTWNVRVGRMKYL